MDVTPPPELVEEALARSWYHTIELAPGVVTPGWFDTRPVLRQIPFPDSLAGKRCLDVGTFDGFWAFEMERRGAAEVVAVDVLDPRSWDWPSGSTDETIAAIGRRKDAHGFELAHRLLRSAVRFEERSVYDLDPDQVGRFDFVYVGSLLLHLRDPIRALERVRAVCAERLLLVENIDLVLSLLYRRRGIATFEGAGRPWWWKANLPALVRMVQSVGFEVEAPAQRVYVPAGPGHPRLRTIGAKMLRTTDGRHLALTALMGDPHAAVAARPV